MSPRPANACSLLGMLFLLGAVLLSNLGAWTGSLGVQGGLAAQTSIQHAVVEHVDLAQMISAGKAMPDPAPQALIDDDQCVLEDNTVDQTLGLPEYFSMALHRTADARLGGHASDLPHSSLARELRPPIV